MPQLLRTTNVCFPRSGHRFLRNILSSYFGEELKLRLEHSEEGYAKEDANYIKDHDVALRKNKSGIPVLEGGRYLIQYRHPLESLVSFYEFQVKHGRREDCRQSWEQSLEINLNYWKRFIEKWCLSDIEKATNVYKVEYRTLCDDTFSTALCAIQFLTGNDRDLDAKLLEEAVAKHTAGFARYVQEEKENSQKLTKIRDIADFKYVDDSFKDIEQKLKRKYLEPMGIKPIFNS